MSAYADKLAVEDAEQDKRHADATDWIRAMRLSTTQGAVLRSWVLTGEPTWRRIPYARRTLAILRERGLTDFNGPTAAGVAYVNREEAHNFAILWGQDQ